MLLLLRRKTSPLSPLSPLRPFALPLPFLFFFDSLGLDFDVLIGTSLAGQNDRPSRRPTSLNSRCLLRTFRAENRQNVRSYDTLITKRYGDSAIPVHSQELMTKPGNE
jgi:hypothetical protein